jgi:hypothetical protein
MPRFVGFASIVAGVIMIVAGVVTYFVVRSELAAENIVVSDDADFLAGEEVNGPFTAYAEAEVIQKHALEAGGGQTYAEIPQDDPTRDTVMNASFLRASLFTSVVAFGVAALVMGLGVMFILFGLGFLAIVKSLHTAAVPAGGAVDDRRVEEPVVDDRRVDEPKVDEAASTEPAPTKPDD